MILEDLLRRVLPPLERAGRALGQVWCLVKTLVDKRHLVLVHDIALAVIALPIALWLRTGSAELMYTTGAKAGLVFALTCGAIYLWLQLYRSAWRFMSWQEVATLAIASFFACAVFFPMTFLLEGTRTWPQGTIFVIWAVLFGLLGVSRLALSVLRARLFEDVDHIYTSVPQARVMLLGKDTDLRAHLKTLLGQEDLFDVVGALESPTTPLKSLTGTKVLGSVQDIEEIIEQLNLEGRHPHHVLVSDPQDMPSDMLLSLSKTLHARGVSLSYMVHAPQGQVSVKPYLLEELLKACAPITKSVPSPVKGKTVLVCQAGQPMGRAVALHIAREGDPKSLAMCDLSETLLWESQQFFDGEELHVDAHLLHARDEKSVTELLERVAPQIVFAEPSLGHRSFVEAHLCQAFVLMMKEAKSLVEACSAKGVERLVYMIPGRPEVPRSAAHALYAFLEGYLVTKGVMVVRVGDIFELPDSFPSRVRRALGQLDVLEVGDEDGPYQSLSLETLGERLFVAVSQLGRKPLEMGQIASLQPDLVMPHQELMEQIAALSPAMLEPPRLKRVPRPGELTGVNFGYDLLDCAKGSAFCRVNIEKSVMASLEGTLVKALELATKGQDEKLRRLMKTGKF